MRKKKTHEEYTKEVFNINQDIEVLGTYITARENILHCCKIDGYEWYAAPTNILKGKGCPKCAGNIKKTHEDFVDELHGINCSIKVLGKYINAHTPILCECLIDGHQWLGEPTNLLHGEGCAVCGRESTREALAKEHSVFIKELQDVNPNIEITGRYFNTHTKVHCVCLIDGHEWDAMPLALLRGSGCAKCAGVLAKHHEQYAAELSNKNPNIEVIEKYINARTKILHKCKVDGCEWYVAPYSVLAGNGCPQCSASRGEKVIQSYLDNNNISFIPQYTFVECRNIKMLPFDFYLPEYNVCIEYDGKQHFEPNEFFGGQTAFEETVRRDKIKTDYCLANNISLLRIRYDEDIIEVLNSFLDNTKLLNEVV